MLSMRTFFLVLLSAGLGVANQDVAPGIEAAETYHGTYYHKTKNCKQGPWKCGECNKYTGTKKCTRKTLVNPSWHGRRCGPSYTKRPCDVDCEVSEWKYSHCNAKCGHGHKVGTRHVIVKPKNYGEKCPKLTRHEKCYAKACPVDCKQDRYNCGKCNYYNGYQTCTRKTLVHPKHYGKPCGPSSHKKKCRVDCKMSDFGEYGNCSKKCGGGYQKRCRTVIHHARNGGYRCPKHCQTRPCNTKDCDRDCEQTDFKCGKCNYNGYKRCHRSITTHPKGYGKKCGKNSKREPCKVNCKVSGYGYWGPCSKRCGYGTRKRCRRVIYEAKNGGDECPSELCQKEKCGKICSVNCKQSPWKCGKCDYSGYRTCNRYIITHAKGHGYKCGANTIKKPCKVDCKVSDYGDYGECSKKCGYGWKTRCRKVVYYPKNGGRYCPKLCERAKCGKICSRDCELTDWKCGKCNYHTGLQRCRRRIEQHPHGYGKKCGKLSEDRKCKVNCKVSDYGDYGYCSKKCGYGVQKRCRTVVYYAKNGGHECEDLCETKKCGKICSVNCKQSPWKCGDCDHYSGYRTCNRYIITHPKGHGYKCGLNKTTKPCKVNCKVSDFGDYDECSKKCGYGVQKRCRTVLYGARHGGHKCPDRCETRKCGKICSRDCEHSAWKCGKCDYHTGERKCYRTIVHHHLGYGKKCGKLSTTKDCKVNCKVSHYRPWGHCSKKCGYGVQRRCRKVVYGAKHGGHHCPKLCERKKCGKPCSRDCVQTPFKCGKCNYHGKRRCTRRIITHPKGYGKKCGRNRKKEHCAVNCKVSHYGHWSKCSKHCGGGSKKRCRRIIRHPKHHGEECPDLCEKEECNTHACGHHEDEKCHCPDVHCPRGSRKWTPRWGKCRCPRCSRVYYWGHHHYPTAIAGVFGLVLVGGAIKFLRRNNSDSYEEIFESELADPVEREQLL